MPDPQFSDPEKLLAAARPKIYERLVAAIKKRGQQDGAPALMGLFLGGIIAPLATLSAGPVAQLISQIISGGNLLANFIQNFATPKPRPESDLPALQECYVPLKARERQG